MLGRLLVGKLLSWFIIKPEESKERTNVLETKENIVAQEAEPSKEELLEMMLKTKDVDAPEIINPDAKKTLLIMNDLQAGEASLKLDFDDMKQNGYDPYADYKIVKCNGKFANLAAYKYIKENHVDVAILDVVTGTNLLMDKEHMVEFNGLDVAEEIKKVNKTSKVAILTSLPLAIKDGGSGLFGEKFKRLTENKTIDKYVNVFSENRADDLEKVMYGTQRA